MEFVKKSFNMNPDIAQRIDDFIRENPGVSFTLVMNQALAQWLKDPKVSFNLPKPMSDDEVDKFMRDNEGLMNKLSK